MKDVKTTANLTCPMCGHLHKDVKMPEDACQHMFKCEGCGETIKSKKGECCVFCSHADTKCPPEQKVK